MRARGRGANARSAVALMSLGVRGGDEVVIAGFEPRGRGGHRRNRAGHSQSRGTRRARRRGVTHAPVGADPRRTTLQPGSLRGVIASRGFASGGRDLPSADDIVVSRDRRRHRSRERRVRSRARRRARAAPGARARLRRATVREIMAAHLELLDDPELVGDARARFAPARARASPGAPACAPARGAEMPPAMRGSPNASTICAISNGRCCAHSTAARPAARDRRAAAASCWRAI